MATHFKGPLLGSMDADGGLFKDLPLGAIDRVRSNYQVWVEPFSEEFATGELILGGAHVDDLNTATSPHQAVTSETGYLLINPGSKADAGSSVVFDIAPTAARLGNSFNTMRALTSSTTLMDNRELIWACRFGLSTDALDFVWDGKVMLGWLTADTTPMANATGLPTLATGGGLGFHIGEAGLVTYFGQQAALTAAGTTTGLNVNTNGVSTGPDVSWFEVGIRCKWTDASDGTGRADFYLNGRKIGTITSGLPMQSTQVYASTFAIQNGPATLSDLYLDYLITAITGPGR